MRKVRKEGEAKKGRDSLPAAELTPAMRPMLAGNEKSRLTVVDIVYHQVVGGQTKQFPGRYFQWLQGHSEAVVRELRIGEEWTELPSLMGDECAMLVIENMEGMFFDRIPSPDAVAEANERVIEYGYGEGTAQQDIAPRMGVRLIPRDLRKVKLRCRKGEATAKIVVVPK